MELKKHWKVFAFYFLLQAIIWAKVFLFYTWYGYGQITHFNKHLFPEELYLANFFFHQAMHLLILVAAFAFARQLDLQKTNDWKLLGLVAAAAVLHNFAYWLSNSYESQPSIIIDFIFDVGTLFALIITSNYLSKKYSFFRNIKIPLLD